MPSPYCSYRMARAAALKGKDRSLTAAAVDGEWQCDTSVGYGGTAKWTCTVDEAAGCEVVSLLEGCEKLPLRSCTAPEVDGCALDTSQCTDVAPGATCRLACRWPYLGLPTFATCPSDNWEAGKVVELDTRLPYCFCPDPVASPGYVQAASGWACDEGYVGEAVKQCVESETCSVEIRLSGCVEERPCLAPEVEDACRVDADACSSVPAGSSCEARCRPPYAGNESSSHCPAFNTDPARKLVYSAPACGVIEDCDYLPAGYLRNGSGWYCAPGYLGSAVVSQGGCGRRLELAGCLPPAPCQTPVVDPCKLEASGCEQVPPGGACEASCRAPYAGNATVLVCPEGNVDPQQHLVGAPPQCELRCAAPRPMPAGYAATPAGFECDWGYTGNATAFCNDSHVVDEGDGNCSAEFVLVGCERFSACAPLELDSPYVAYGCSSVASGESCEVRCRDPYVGEPTAATCPYGSSGAAQPLLYTLPSCDLSCDTVPVGENEREIEFNFCANSGGRKGMIKEKKK
ncbi:unnamed protein product [Prorocentrum cordatum]|uniref:Uncharacterized protein n=1 Tax=Prorocentrum cordatum TaxID=2364126 RepID=A0ABN9RXG0_9DINO|nr:unnamed protein product [Polarella glacialis]